MSSEQDKRPVYMGNFERFKKEIHVKHEDVVTQIGALAKISKYNTIIAGVALGAALVALAM
jgi:hypothetical protein